MSKPRQKLREYREKRDFDRTPEPSGGGLATQEDSQLQFVVQKHAARHLHFDLRLELGGVMKSWAVPKGPSLDPSVKRLAVEVEDHPMEYNEFEGTIPPGEYGGGTVMLWDRGFYAPDEGSGDPEQDIAKGLKKGKLSFTLHGERLKGSFALIRTSKAEEGKKAQWLLKKHEDEFTTAEEIAELDRSVTTGRTMEEIAAGKRGRKTWKSNRTKPTAQKTTRKTPSLTEFSPMLARTAGEIPEGDDWIFEPKYDGIRLLAFATPTSVALLTRNNNDKTAQFPEVASELKALSQAIRSPVVLDGELVATEKGRVVRFEALQERIHVRSRGDIDRLAQNKPAAFIAFDLLLEGENVRIETPWSKRRAALERLLKDRTTAVIRLGETEEDGDALLRRGEKEGWEGIIAKRADSPYRPGKRSGDWLKVKLEQGQEFVLGGWTEPRNSRQHLGAILLGYYDASGEFVYAGHTGTGFTRETLEETYRRLKRLERKTPPFHERPETNEPAHWTTPRVVVEVKFNEWTKEGRLRQPVFLGVREDKNPKEVVRESAPGEDAVPARGEGRKGHTRQVPPAQQPSLEHAISTKIRELGKGGRVQLAPRVHLHLTNLEKVFFPKSKITKGDVLRYYSGMAEYILPWMQDRPLVLKRYPDGIEGEAFYQQSAPTDVPPGVRVETVQPGPKEKKQRRFVGGDLVTLLYTVQLGAISYDPWHSRVGSLSSADYTILDLDPGAGTSFQRVVEVALWVKEEMDALGLHGALKTSGSSGLHIYLPLPEETPLEAATLIAQILATRVTQKHPTHATVERMVRKRPKGTVYVDYLQNILGKTVAGVYAVRAKPGATVATPLQWDELTSDLDFRKFTIKTVPKRVQELGDLWAVGMAKPNTLDSLLTRRRATNE